LSAIFGLGLDDAAVVRATANRICVLRLSADGEQRGAEPKRGEVKSNFC
jgi:hypothetical protein